MELSFSEYMQYLLHNFSQALLVPTMVALALCVAIAIVILGVIIAEFFTERRHFKVNTPVFLADIAASPVSELPGVIDKGGMLKNHRRGLKTLVKYLGLPEETRISLAKRLLSNIEQGYQRRVSLSDVMSKVSPMLGLMGTLIPLGPGIVALGEGKTELLSSSIMIAFDTTVVGLVAAVICFVISRIRRGWYEDYMVSLDAAFTAVLEKAADYQGPRVADMTAEELKALAPAPQRGFFATLFGGKSKKKGEK